MPAFDDGAKLPEMVGAVIYVRVSTKEQTENLSLPTQLRACEEYCRRQGYEILERFHEEGESAKTTDRSQLQALLKYCRTHKGKVHFVVVYNLTRFAREKYDHFALRAHLKSLGISLRSATEPIDDTSTGKLMEGVLAAFAQFDNDVRSDRTRAGMRAALELGRWTFPAPLGYLNAPKWSSASLVHDPERGPLVRRAFEDLATGQYTKQEVIARATAAGLRSRKGLTLSPQSFGQMMRNPIYVGKVESPDYGVSVQGRLRAARRRGHVLPCAGRARRPRRCRRSAAAEPPGLPAARLRALRDLRPAADRQLVEGPQRPLRVLPLPAPVSRGERQQGRARRRVRRRTRAAAADTRLHAPGQGSHSLRLGAAAGGGEGPDGRAGEAGQGDPAEARPARRSVPLPAVDRRSPATAGNATSCARS